MKRSGNNKIIYEMNININSNNYFYSLTFFKYKQLYY